MAVVVGMYDVVYQFQCCFTSTETVRLIRDGESRTATSTFTQIWFNVALHPHKSSGLPGTESQGRPPPVSHRSGSMLLYVHINHQAY